MPENRFYIDKKFPKDEPLTLDGGEYQHFIHVMRGKVNDSIEVVNGMGELATVRVTSISKKEAFLEIEKSETKPPPTFQLVLAQAIPRMNRLDFIVEKGTELGMTELLLFPGVHSEREKLTDEQLHRMRLVAISAIKQCGRLDLPAITSLPPLKAWKKSPDMNSYFGDVRQNAPRFIDTLQKSPPQKGILIFIGPESGFSDGEVALMKKLGAEGVHLHPNILRTETAAMVGLSIAAQFATES